MAEAKARVPMPVLGYCLMSNHWYLVLWPEKDGQLSAFVGWLSNTHAHRYREHYHDVGHGHVYQSWKAGHAQSCSAQDSLVMTEF